MVSPLVTSLLVFLGVFGGALIGLFLRAVLPEHHLDADSRNAIKAGLGLLAILIFWLALIFAGFGLLVSTRPTVISVLLISAISLACAVYLVMDLDRPLEGLVQISEPLRDASRLLAGQ
jgi:hypothetical protein